MRNEKEEEYYLRSYFVVFVPIKQITEMGFV